jgi:hypothetical protein
MLERQTVSVNKNSNASPGHEHETKFIELSDFNLHVLPELHGEK